MRTLASSIQTLLASGENVEPVAIIGVLWNDQGSEIIYADRDIIDPNNPANVLAPGRILEMGHFDDAQKSDSSGSSGSVSVVLDDRDGCPQVDLRCDGHPQEEGQRIPVVHGSGRPGR